MFNLVHDVVSGIALPQVVGGIAFGVSYEVERTLIVPITFHTLGNLAIYVLSLLF